MKGYPRLPNTAFEPAVPTMQHGTVIGKTSTKKLKIDRCGAQQATVGIFVAALRAIQSFCDENSLMTTNGTFLYDGFSSEAF